MDSKKLLRVGMVVLVALLVTIIIGGSVADDEIYVVEPTNTNRSSSEKVVIVRQYKNVRDFSALEFKQAYDNLSLPNITPIVIPPIITGNIETDKKIVDLAEARGYQLRHVASGLLNALGGKPVQELLIQDWNSLVAAAQDDGVVVNLVSGYRSVKEQTDLFINRLYGTGVTNDSIAAGLEDDIVLNVLALVAPPGYSRHHSGYTIDLSDPGFSIFKGSTAEQWLSVNNYENAKKYGFIPSYPEGLENQGPNPEPWEYVWIGKDITYEQEDV